ncbi:helix-turn-helix domain-containing protein [Variovorax sp.]|jgi:AraC-like DNA-binding protein|uniref:helix-turn-helix domain-containing protein n=1 Tax=Variovorax sp. TaxID=1871043 RepID=UPI0037D9F315
MSIATAFAPVVRAPYAPAGTPHLREPHEPAFEHALLRDPSLGFETAPSSGIGCLVHGAPSRLDRWHYHDEYELHLVVKTRGKAYIGDEIMDFAPGFLALIGPSVPHHFVSHDVPAGGVAVRSLAIQFSDDALRQASGLFPDLGEALRLLERARHGIEFAGMGEEIREHFHRIRAYRGLARFTELVALLSYLATWPESHPLSMNRALPRPSQEVSERLSSRIDKAVGHICEHYMEDLSLPGMGELAGMGAQTFSRSFHRVMGCTFVEFVTRTRITKACHLLRDTDQQISAICYQVGFNNISNFNRHFRRLRGMTPAEYRGDKAFLQSAGA